jgi:hypothetical protein
MFSFLTLCGLSFDSLPRLHTPYGVLVVFTMIAGLLQPSQGRINILLNPIAPLFVLLATVLIFFGIIGHGDPAMSTFRVRTHLMGMCPFILAWLILKTPRQAVAVLIAVIGTHTAVALGLPALMVTSGQSALAGSATGLNMNDFAEEQAGFAGNLSYTRLVAWAQH